MRPALLLLAALIGAAAAQPAAVARIAARSPVARLALDLMAPSPTFTVQSSSGRAPRPASDDKLRAYCKLLRTRTPGVCYAATEEGAFARSLCPNQCAPSASAGRALLAANTTEQLKPCSQTADISELCSFFIEQAEGACTTAGFLSVYMRTECRKSCGFCTSDTSTEAPKAPTVERPPEPACDKAPDAGSACPFFFSNLANPCSEATAGDAWIANYTRTQCQTSCGICLPVAPEPSPSSEPAAPSPLPSPTSSGSSACEDLSTASFSCTDVVKQELCGQPWAAGWCAKSCGYCDDTPASPPAEQPATSPSAEEPAALSPSLEQPAAFPVAEEQPAPASLTTEEEPAPPSPAAEEQPAPVSPDTEEQPAPASPTAQQPDSPTPVEEQPAPASPSAEDQPPGSPATDEQPTPASPATDEPVPPSPAAEEQPAASPVAEEQPNPSPTAEEPVPASPAAGGQPAPSSHASEEAAPALEPANATASPPTPASPAVEEPQPAEELSPLPSPSTPSAKEPAPVPAESPATQEPASPSPSPSPAAPRGSYGTPSRPGGYSTSPAPSLPSASPSPDLPSSEPRLTTAAVCQALACLSLPPSGDRLLSLPGVASCPNTPCRLPAVECPSGCSAHGACHVSAGACVCFEGYTGADCADCAVGFEKAASGVCAKTEMEQAAQGPAPIRPLFDGAEAVTGRHLMAASKESATVTAVGSQMVGTTGTERLALSLPSGWIAGVVVAGAVGMVAVAAALLMRGRPSAGPLPL